MTMDLKLNLLPFLLSSLLSLFFLFHVQAQSSKCTDQSVFCNSNCSAVLGCIGPGQDPFVIKNCPTESPCKKGTEADKPAADCTGAPGDTCESPQSSASIVCGSLGELPHPTECGSTVKCETLKVAPASKCDCAAGSFPDLSRVSLPCKAGSCPRESITCETVGVSGSLQQNSDYCYICGKNNQIILRVCDGSAKRKALPEFFAANEKKCK